MLADREYPARIWNYILSDAFKYNFPSKDSRMRKKKKEWNIQKLNRTNFPWFKLSNFWKWQTQHVVHVCTCQMTPLTHLILLVGTCLLAACFAMCPGQVSWMKWAPVPANVWILHLSRHTFKVAYFGSFWWAMSCRDWIELCPTLCKHDMETKL